VWLADHGQFWSQVLDMDEIQHMKHHAFPR